MQEFSKKQGDVVTFDNGSISGKGIIKGSSTTPMPILGTGYILEVIECVPALPNEVYPFDHIVMYESNFIE